MKKGTLTREQAVEVFGEDNVRELESHNCEPTGRVGYNGAVHGDSLCEWSASAEFHDRDENSVSLIAYHYTTNEEDAQIAAADGDGSAITWKIHGFEIV
jgi:hypothetical protein